MPVFLLPILGAIGTALRLPALAAFLAGLVSNVLAWFAQYFARNTAINLTIISTLIVLTAGTADAIIVSGTPEKLEKIELILGGIDKPQRQVYIEAAITEAEMCDSDEFGINLTGAFGDAGILNRNYKCKPHHR